MTRIKIASETRTLRVLAMSALVAASLGASLQSAAARSALAAGIPDDVAKSGVTFGEAHGFSTTEEAESRALDQCRKPDRAPPDTLALCKIIGHFDHRCVAVALDPKDGTPGFGWAIADTANDANDQALASCHASAGDRAPYCVITNSACDTIP